MLPMLFTLFTILGFAAIVKGDLDKDSSILFVAIAKRAQLPIGQEIARVEGRYAHAFHNFHSHTGRKHPLSEMKHTRPLILQAERRKEDAEGTSKSERSSSEPSGSIELTDLTNDGLTDQNWLGPATFGTPGQLLKNLNFDTGSADIVINKSAYNPSKSSTANDTGETFDLRYLDGRKPKVRIYEDVVKVGGLTARGVPIGSASSDFLDAEDGVFGIAGQLLSAFPPQLPTWSGVLKQTGAIRREIFGFKLTTQAARLDIGGVAPEYALKLVYTPYDKTAGFFIVNGTVNGRAFRANMDTGTTYIAAPMVDAAKVCTEGGGYSFIASGDSFSQCTFPNTAPPPPITFRFDGFQKTLSAQSSTYDRGKVNSTSTVFGLKGITIWTVGDSFFKDVYSVFDKEDSRLGFAHVRH